MTQLTDEQKVLKGKQAEAFLKDPVLMGFFEELQADTLTCIGNTQPEDHKTRTSLYYMHRGLVDLKAHLTAYCETAKAIIERDNATLNQTDLETD